MGLFLCMSTISGAVQSLPPSSYFATSSESSRSTFDTSPHSFS